MEFYITFKEFKENYEKDLTEWLNTYPDATEEDYIKEVFNYLDIRLSFFKREKDGIGLKDGFLIERYNRVDLEDYFIDGLYYAYCLENRILETIYNYYNSQINLGKIKESEVADYMKNFSCLDGNKDPRYYLNEIQESKIYITPKFAKKFLNANRLKNGNEFDNFMIRKECMNMHLYFFSIESNYQDWEVSFNEEKYRNFGFAIKRIYEFLNNRLEELKNPPQRTESLPAPFTTSLEWNAQKNIIGTLFGCLYDIGAITGTKKDLAQGLSTLFPNLSNHSLLDNINRKIKENEGKVLYDIDTEIKIKPFLEHLKEKVNKK